MSLSERVKEGVGTEDNRRVVINTFNDVYRQLQARTASFRHYWEVVDRSPLHWNNYFQEMTLLSDLYIVRHGVLAVGGNEFGVPYDLEDYTFPVEVPGQFSIREGLPVEGLLSLLELELTGTDRSEPLKSARRSKLQHEQELLLRNSMQFSTRHNHGDDFFWQRRALEASIISDNPLRASWSGNPQYAMFVNWIQASIALGRRRDLIVPSL